jgi:hypothetical protein
MSNHDVGPNEMNETPAFDENAIAALLAGDGHSVSPQLADLVSDMRMAYTSVAPTAGAEVAAFMGTAAVAAPIVSRRFERMRASMLARMGAAASVVIAATGGLAVAGALPGPVQNLVSHVGIASSSHGRSDSAPGLASSTTTSTEPTETTFSTSTTVAEDNHGAVVSGVAHDDSLSGCEHGAAVSAVASDGRSNNDGQSTPNSNAATNWHDGSCTTPTTTVDNGTPSSTSTTTSTTDKHTGEHGGTTPTSLPDVSGGDNGAGHGKSGG